MADWVPSDSDYELWLQPKSDQVIRYNNTVKLWLGQSSAVAGAFDGGAPPTYVSDLAGGLPGFEFDEGNWLDLRQVAQNTAVGAGRVSFILVAELLSGDKWANAIEFTLPNEKSWMSVYLHEESIQLSCRRTMSDGIRFVSVPKPLGRLAFISGDFHPSAGTFRLRAAGQEASGNYASSGLLPDYAPPYATIGQSLGHRSIAMRLGEVCVLRNQTDEMVDRFEGAIAHRWSLASDLTASHPYLKEPPTSEESLSGNVTTSAGHPGEHVRIFDWPSGRVEQVIAPDAAGAWAAVVPPGQYGVTYIAPDCQPLTHGPYTVEHP